VGRVADGWSAARVSQRLGGDEDRLWSEESSNRPLLWLGGSSNRPLLLSFPHVYRERGTASPAKRGHRTRVCSSACRIPESGQVERGSRRPRLAVCPTPPRCITARTAEGSQGWPDRAERTRAAQRHPLTAPRRAPHSSTTRELSNPQRLALDIGAFVGTVGARVSLVLQDQAR
jgi:hypothetical protein